MFTFDTSNPSFDPMTSLREAFSCSNLSWEDFENTICDTLDKLYAEEEAKKQTPIDEDTTCDPSQLSWNDLFDSIIKPWCITNLSNGSTIETMDAEDYTAYRKECFNYLQEALNTYLNARKIVEKLKSATSNGTGDLNTLFNLLFGDR